MPLDNSTDFSPQQLGFFNKPNRDWEEKAAAVETGGPSESW